MDFPTLAINPQWTVSSQIPREYWMHSPAASSLVALERCYTIFFVLANPWMKMFGTLLMCSTMTTQTIRRIISIVLVVLVVLVPRELPLLSLPLTVSTRSPPISNSYANTPQTKSRLVI